MAKPLRGDLADGHRRTEKGKFVQYQIAHQLPNCCVGQSSEPPLEQPSHTQCADHSFKRVLGGRESSLFFDEALHADFCCVLLHDGPVLRFYEVESKNR